MMLMYVTVCLAAVAAVQGFSDGAPEGACVDMVPKHPVAAQKSAAPYVITTKSKVVKAGTPLELVVSGKGASNTIRGLLLQARHNGKPVGKFTIPPNDHYSKLLNCGAPGNAVTHRKHSDKADPQTLAFIWTPPADFNDEVKFRATVALNGAVFWIGVESAPIKVSQ